MASRFGTEGLLHCWREDRLLSVGNQTIQPYGDAGMLVHALHAAFATGQSAARKRVLLQVSLVLHDNILCAATRNSGLN